MSEEEEVSLNLFQQYRHTIKLDRTTSRMKNKDWYRDALELDVQLHCYVNDLQHVDCYLFIRSRQHYEQIGSLDFYQLENSERREGFVQEILNKDTVRAAKPKSLGIVCYLADDFSLAGLGPEHQDAEALQELSQQMVCDPRAVLEDKTVSTESHAWRIFPYTGVKAGGEFATAVAVPSALNDFLIQLRDYGNSINLPIRTCALSAPLCAVASLPWCAATSPQGTVAIYNFHKFTVLAFFDARCELMMLRHIGHSQGASVPRNLGPSVFSAATSFELENPEIYIFPMTGVDVQGEVLSLQTAMKESSVMVVEASDVLKSRGVNVSIPLEMLTVCNELDPAVYPLAGNATFSDFAEQHWPFQDFLPPSQLELSQTPGAKAMLLLKISRWVKIAAALLFAALFAYTGLDVVKKITSESWSVKTGDQKAEMAKLQKRLKDFKRLDNLLVDRSKAWVSMEFINELIPQDGSIVITSVSHSVKRVPVRKNSSSSGLAKTWVIQGMVGEKGLEQLEDYNVLDSKKMKEVFQKVAEKTGNDAYWPDHPGRDLTVQFSHKVKGGRRNSSSSSSGLELSRTFSLTITQSFSASDSVVIK